MEFINNHSESTGNNRKAEQQRGKMTVEAEREARIKALLERRAQLVAENERLVEENTQIDAILSGRQKEPSVPPTDQKDDAKEVDSSNPGDTTLSIDHSSATSAAPESSSDTSSSTTTTSEEADSPELTPVASEEPDLLDDAPATPEQVESVANASKKNNGIKKFLATALIGGLTAIMIAGGIKNKSKTTQPESTPISQDKEIKDPSDFYSSNFENQESQKGIQDAYDKKGMWLSGTKSSEYAFASASEVAEVCDNDECEMIKYTAHNQVESFADYLANLPEQLQPEGFKGLSIIETEQKLESLSDEEYDNIRNQFDETIDNAFTRRTKLDGQYSNAYMRLRDGASGVTHDNMELVECTTNENNLEVTQFYWTDQDGNEIGSMTVKIIHNEDGTIEGCEQVVNKVGEKAYLYAGLVSIPDLVPSTPTPDQPTPTPDQPTPTPDQPTPTPTPDQPTPTPTPENPTVTPAPKNPEAERENAGPNVTPLELDENVTPSTTLEQDQANFEAIRQQQADDANKATEAERVANEQATKEAQATTEAENRRQTQEANRQNELNQMSESERQQREAGEAEAKRLANEAADKAVSEAAKVQEEKAEQERQNAAERESREQTQTRANNQAEANSAEATSNQGATDTDRSAALANGDF
ncbi:hypothetical protein IKF30_01280 [Candidatus Saccharibacteria bacterium]|nr:hypothetical protein [Candidatus Saccharibacteria bacterium]